MRAVGVYRRSRREGRRKKEEEEKEEEFMRKVISNENSLKGNVEWTEKMMSRIKPTGGAEIVYSPVV